VRVTVNLGAFILGTVSVIGIASDPVRSERLPGFQEIDTFVPARRLSGPFPALPSPNVIGWIEETLELMIDTTGSVARMTPLRASPLLADPIPSAVANWRFLPAHDSGLPVPSRALVAAVIRPPDLFDGPTPGDPPVDLATPSDEIPYPIATTPPRYPPLAIGDGVVLLEVLVDRDGRPAQVRIVTDTSAFDQASLAAAAFWSFRPAKWNGRTVEAYAYLMFGFRQPVVGDKRSVGRIRQ
jgi:TonB family protein